MHETAPQTGEMATRHAAQPAEDVVDSRVRHPSSRAGTPPGVHVTGPTDLSPRDRAYAVGTVNRLRRVQGTPHEAAVLSLDWHQGEERPAVASLCMTGSGRSLEMTSFGRSFIEALDRLEVSVRLAVC